jgi:ABC-type bacteriocin/lantibiotic exporter with double-glycine peptidase domain
MRAAGLVAVFFGVLGLAGSAGSAGIWLDVPFVSQPQEGCGAASIAMVMEYWIDHGARVGKASAEVTTIQLALHSNQAKGIFAADVDRYFRQAGFRTFTFRGSWTDLRQHLSQGRPLIAGIRSGGAGNQLHYVVVAGLDWEQNLVLVNDPARRKLLKLRRSEFENAWKATDDWTLLALPQQVN